MHELEVDMWYRCGTCEVQSARCGRVVPIVNGIQGPVHEVHGLVAAVNHHMHLIHTRFLTPCPKTCPKCPFQTNPIANILKITGL